MLRDILLVRTVLELLEEVRVDGDIPVSGFLLDVEDPLGRRVQLTASQWFGHIIANHPELSRLESEVRFALIQPDFICTDAEIKRRVCHYRRVSYGSHSNKYLKVVVQREFEFETGVVITAFVTSRVKANEEVIYGQRIS